MTDLPSGANTVTATFGDATDTVTFNVDPNGGIGGETTPEVEILGDRGHRVGRGGAGDGRG